MAYVSIPKDLTGIKTKFLMGLTKRQTVCFGAAAATGLPFFFLIKTFAPVSLSAFVMVIIMLPWFMFAMYEKNGQPLEKFLRCIITVKLTRPKVRTYQTENLYALTGRQNQLYREVQSIVTGKEARRG
jgi:hypothetical protein